MHTIIKKHRLRRIKRLSVSPDITPMMKYCLKHIEIITRGFNYANAQRVKVTTRYETVIALMDHISAIISDINDDTSTDGNGTGVNGLDTVTRLSSPVTMSMYDWLSINNQLCVIDDILPDILDDMMLLTNIVNDMDNDVNSFYLRHYNTIKPEFINFMVGVADTALLAM